MRRGEPRPGGARARPVLDAGLTRLARYVVPHLYREIEFVGRAAFPASGPVIVISNHVNSLVDGGLLLAYLPRIPRFLSASTVWDFRAVAPFLNGSGAVKVYRRQDGREHLGSLDDTFAEAAGLMAAGGVLAVFPEGRTHDTPVVLEFKTGTARIAIQAELAHGPLDLKIVPVGLDYAQKDRLRSTACMGFGAPLTIAAEAAQYAAADAAGKAEVVRALTARLRRSLLEVAPDFASPAEARALTMAGEILAAEAQPPTGATQAQPPTWATQAQPPTGATQAQPPTGATQAQPPTRATQAQPPTRATQAQPPTGATQAQPPTGAIPAEPPTGEAGAATRAAGAGAPAGWRATAAPGRSAAAGTPLVPPQAAAPAVSAPAMSAPAMSAAAGPVGGGDGPGFSQIVAARRVAQAGLAALAPADASKACRALGRYARLLDAAGLTDADTRAAGPRGSLWAAGLVALLGAPVVALALGLNGAQALVLWRVARRQERDKRMTWVTFGGLTVYLFTWPVIALVLGVATGLVAGAGWGWAVALSTLPISLLSGRVALAVIDRAVLAWHAMRARWILRRPGVARRLAARRATARAAALALAEAAPAGDAPVAPGHGAEPGGAAT